MIIHYKYPDTFETTIISAGLRPEATVGAYSWPPPISTSHKMSIPEASESRRMSKRRVSFALGMGVEEDSFLFPLSNLGRKDGCHGEAALPPNMKATKAHLLPSAHFWGSSGGLLSHIKAKPGFPLISENLLPVI